MNNLVSERNMFNTRFRVMNKFNNKCESTSTVENEDADICWQIELFFQSYHACILILTVKYSSLSLLWVRMLEKVVGDFYLNKETKTKSLPFHPVVWSQNPANILLLMFQIKTRTHIWGVGKSLQSCMIFVSLKPLLLWWAGPMLAIFILMVCIMT